MALMSLLGFRQVSFVLGLMGGEQMEIFRAS